MAFVVADRVKETTTTTGTGAVALAGAVTGFRTFASGIGNSNTTYYTIASQTANEWEVGFGTLDSTSANLARTTVLASSNGGSLVTFSAGTKDVFVTQSAARTLVQASGGTTTNGVLYYTGSGVATGGSALTFDGSEVFKNSGGTIQYNDVSGSAAAGTRMSAGGTLGTDSFDLFQNASIAGIYNRASTPIAFAISSIEQMRLTSTGLGIGTSSPSYKLDVVGEVRANNLFRTTDGTNIGLFGSGVFASGVVGIGSSNSVPLVFGTGATERARIDSSGNLGIGTSSPSGRLNIVGGSLATSVTGLSIATDLATGRLVTDASSSRISSLNSYYDTQTLELSQGSTSGYVSGIVISARGATSTAPDSVTFWTRSAERMRLDNSGNLGIGTSSPSSRLDVTGGNIVVDGFSSGYGIAFRQGFETTANLKIYASDPGGFSRNGALFLSAYDGICFGTGSNTFQERMRIDNAGNVGIGTSSPSNLLHIKATTNPVFRLEGATDSGYVDYNGTRLQLSAGGGALYFVAGNAERARIDSSGNLGIGTTSPVAKLDVRSGYIVSGTNTSTSGTKILGGYYGSGQISTFGSEYSTGAPVIGYGVWPSTSASGAFVSSSPVGLSRGAYTISGDQHIWYSGASQTVAIDSAVTTSEKMRLTSSGGLSVGTTADPGAGAIYATGNITAYYSDDRLKNRLGSIESALDKVDQLSGFYYEANETAQQLGYKPKREVGVSAQDVQKVMPEIVSPAPIDPEYLTISYERLVPLLVEAIKELRAEVRALRQ